MRPNDTTQPLDDQRGSITPPLRDHSRQHDAVAQMTREQINAIYNQQKAPESAAPVSGQSEQPAAAIYHNTQHNPHTVAKNQWQQYHSSWQNYYQKYYEQYYVGAVESANQTFKAHAEKLQEENRELAAKQVSEKESMSEDEALDDLRSQLLGKVRTSAKKVRKSRHFIPLVSAACVFLMFGFLQYNAVIFGYVQAYTSPGNIDPGNIIVDPSTSVKVNPAPRLIIPKLNIDVGVDYNAKPQNEGPNGQLEAMKKNVAYFGGFRGVTSKPGELGNFGIAGHSSNEWYTTGDQELKFVFVRLESMQKGDVFYLNYKGTRYTYSVTKKLVVGKDAAAKLDLGRDKPYATLITCVPIGVSNPDRLLVIGEQISPAPSKATKAPEASSTEATPEIAGKDPTLIERLFGGR
ncbi:MAG TPA: sortase [Candidatus Saccharimonadales bacterium]